MNKQRSLLGVGTVAVTLASIGAAAWYVCRARRATEGDEALDAFVFEPMDAVVAVTSEVRGTTKSVGGLDDTVNGETSVHTVDAETRSSNFLVSDDGGRVQSAMVSAAQNALFAAGNAANGISSSSSGGGGNAVKEDTGAHSSEKGDLSNITAMLDETLNELENVGTNGSAVATTAAATDAHVDASISLPSLTKPASSEASVAALMRAGATFIDRLGVWIKLPDGWEANREFTPSPNIVIISINNPAMGSATEAETLGQIPILALTAEDVRRENLNLVEFNERSKEVSLQQMLMLTGGAIRPSIRRDSAITVGPFRRVLEYAQYVPSFFDVNVINLSEMRNGIAYSLQITCDSTTIEQFKSMFMQLAQDIHIEPIPLTQSAYLDVVSNGVNVHIDPTWGVSATHADADGAPLVAFHHLSSVKREEMVLYTRDQAPELREKVRSAKTVGDVTVTSHFDGAREIKSVTCGEFVMHVRPTQKAISFIPEEHLIAAMQSVAVTSVAAQPLVRFVDTENKYSFEMKTGSQVISSVLNKGTVIYVLQGNPQDIVMQQTPEERGPLVTIRFGTPEDEPDCMSSLEEWRARIEGDETLGTISNLREITLKNTRCLHFTSKAMQEIQADTRVEMKEGVYIFVRNGVSTVLRWETVTSQWRKYESDMNNFIESFTFMD